MIRKVRRLTGGEFSFFHRPLGLQARVTLLVALIVVSVLVLFSYLDLHLTEQSQQEMLRERTIYVTRELDAKVFTMKDLEDPSALEGEIAGWMYMRPSIKAIDIFVFYKSGYKVVVSSSEEINLGITIGNLQSLRNNLVLSTLKQDEGKEYWEIFAPLHMGRKIVGGIRILNSLEEVEAFLANKRLRTFIFTLISVAILILILTLFFSRAVHRPIQRLVRAMSEAEEGKLNVAVPVEFKDELGLLADHFNRMLSRINQFNEELTQRVESATRELAQRNEELRLANESLFQAQQQLVQAEKLSALGQVAATMAHEIGTPLNSISGYIQLLLDEGTGSEVVTKRLKIIESQLDRLAQTIRNLLHSTRQPEPKLRSLDINPVLESLINFSQPGMLMHGIQLVRKFQPSLPPVSGDPGLLQQVFLNLINNALDAMPHGGILTIATGSRETSTSDGRFVQIDISDNGMGMSPEIKRKALEPFFTTKEPGKGAGLGLAICDEIIRSHNGRLEVESQEGKGSTFRVKLPLFLKEVD